MADSGASEASLYFPYMDKLVERESAPRNPLAAAPALAVQFFLIPLAVVAIAVGMYVGFRSLLADTRTPHDYLVEVRTGGMSRAWPAALELSAAMEDPKARSDKQLAVELVQAFSDANDGDPRVRKYLALAIGRLDPPFPPDAVDVLLKSLDIPDKPWTPDPWSRFNGWTPEMAEARISTIWALGGSGDERVVARLTPLFDISDAGVRKIVVYALGALPGSTQLETLRTALRDEAPDVRWNAAVALARKGSHEGVPVVKQMLDRTYVEQAVKRQVRLDEDRDPIAEVMISGLRAAAVLKDEALKPLVSALSQNDRSMKVRDAALEALKVMG